MTKALCSYCLKQYQIEELSDTPFGLICNSCNDKILKKIKGDK